MRRRAALYLLLGLTTALLIVALATGMQTGGSRNPNVWLGAHQHLFLLQMLDLAALFLFVVIGLYGLTVTRLHLQLRHQAEDFGDQMQTLVHRNEELAKVNEEYAEQIAALEVRQEAPPILSLGDTGQKVIAALHWQVDAQARQLEGVHRTLDQQHAALQELQQQVLGLAESGAPPLTGGAPSPQLSEASLPPTPPAQEIEVTPLSALPVQEVPEPEAAILEIPLEQAEEPVAVAEWTGNNGSTLVEQMLEFDVGGLLTPEPPPEAAPKPIVLAEIRNYPVDDSMLAALAGHLSSIPESSPVPTPEPETERIEISVRSAASKPSVSAPVTPVADPEDLSPPKTQAAVAFDQAEYALSSLQSETQEALSSLQAQIDAALPPDTTPAPPAEEPEKPAHTPRRKPWRLRF